MGLALHSTNSDGREQSAPVAAAVPIVVKFASSRRPIWGKLASFGAGLPAENHPAAGDGRYLLLIWQLLCEKARRELPAPSVVWAQSQDLILHPFFDYGSQGHWPRLARACVAGARGLRFRPRRGRRHLAWRADRPIGLGDARGLILSFRFYARCRRLPGCRSRSRLSETAVRRRSS